jgi:integrase
LDVARIRSAGLSCCHGSGRLRSAVAERFVPRECLRRDGSVDGRQIRLWKTCKKERAAQIELGKLLEQAAAGRQPEPDATVAQLMDRYVGVADWDLSTRKANEVYIRRVIKPALGHLQVREMSDLQDVPVATLQHALAVLADEGLVVVRQGRTAVVAGDPVIDRRSGRAPRDRDHDCRRAGCQPHVCRPMTAKTIRNIHSILSGAFATAKRWEWIARNPAESAQPPAVMRRPPPATTPEDVAKVITEGRKTHPVLALYLWLVAISGARRGELCALQVGDIDLNQGVLHIAFNYVVVDGQRVRKDTKTLQDRYLAIDPVTCAMIREHLDAIRAELAGLGLQLPADAYVFSNDPMGARPWNPDWATHKASDLAAAAGVKLNIKGLRHYTASQLLAARFDLRAYGTDSGAGSFRSIQNMQMVLIAALNSEKSTGFLTNALAPPS